MAKMMVMMVVMYLC